jgi:GMP synthase (glutamine-hydrolysing)
MSANDDDKHDFIAQELRWIDKVMAADVPFLGICLGAQMLARVLGAEVRPHDEGWHEIGFCEIAPTEAGAELLNGLRYVYHWHGEGFDMPAGAELLATGASGHFPNQFYRVGKQAFGLQFHPECTREIIEIWMNGASEKLSEPGAQQPDEQIARAEKYDHLVDAWVPGFLGHWLGPDEEEKTARSAAS